MTKPLRQAIEIIVRKLPVPKNILEIGSRLGKNQEELANLRPLFPHSNYTGTDMEPGAGVDRVLNGEKLPFKNGTIDLILCLETLEHTQKPWLVSHEIERVLKSGGFVIASSQQNYPIHLHPYDYFRYTPWGLSQLFEQLTDRLVVTISPPFDDEVRLNPHHVILIGCKGSEMKFKNKLKTALLNGRKDISVHKPYRHRLRDGLKFIKRGIMESVYQEDIEFFDRI